MITWTSCWGCVGLDSFILADIRHRLKIILCWLFFVLLYATKEATSFKIQSLRKSIKKCHRLFESIDFHHEIEHLVYYQGFTNTQCSNTIVEWLFSVLFAWSSVLSLHNSVELSLDTLRAQWLCQSIVTFVCYVQYKNK